MKSYLRIILYTLYIVTYFFAVTPSIAEVEIKMDTTTIKGNTELPKIIYIVPWQEAKQFKSKAQQLIIHSLYGDLFDPVLPTE